MMYLLALAIAVDIACIFIVAGGNRFDDYNEETTKHFINLL